LNAGNGKAGTLAKAPGPVKLFSDDADNVADSTREGKLWPSNVSRLHDAGVLFDWKQADQTLIVTCPECSGRLLMDEAQPYALCFSSIRCGMNRRPFAQVVKALALKVEVAK